MKILFIQREDTDLHHTFFSSETSRLALRFYHPRKVPCGVVVEVASLGSALSLVSELRWYIRRYVRETLFEIQKGVYCTQTLAQDIYYERTAILTATWPFRRIYGYIPEKPIRRRVMEKDSSRQDYSGGLTGATTIFEVWCTEEEVEDIGDLISLEDAGENPPVSDGQ